jgi:ATP-dependent Lon protease
MPTLPMFPLGGVLLPSVYLPLHVFEPRYREMLRDVLANDRIFAIARLDPSRSGQSDQTEPLSHIASIGIIRACQKEDNDTSNLLLQGLCRVEVTDILREEPYRVVAVQPITTTAGANQAELEVLRLEVMRLLNLRRRLGGAVPKGMTQFLESIDDIDSFADIAAFNLCDNSTIKQQLLETLETRRRLQLFAAALKAEIGNQRLRRKLQGPLQDDNIGNN